MTIVVLIFTVLLLIECYDLWNGIILLITSISICIGLIWLNVFLSNILCSYISNHFIIYSLVLNLIIYLIIFSLYRLIYLYLLKKIWRKKHEKEGNLIDKQTEQKYESYSSLHKKYHDIDTFND